MNETEIKEMSIYKFRKIVKSQTVKCALTYLISLKNLEKYTKGKHIEYNELELQEYLTPSANLNLEQQREIFSFRCKMNLLKEFFSNMIELESEKLVSKFQSVLNNCHMTWCPILNEESEYKYKHLLNETITEQIKTYQQTRYSSRNHPQ